MISAIRRQISRRRRDRARGPLIDLLRACAGHAMAPLAGQEISLELLQLAERGISAGLAALADAGALDYFGIRDAAELGEPPVTLRLLSDEGHATVVVEPLVTWIFAGGARGVGWRSPARLTLADLG